MSTESLTLLFEKAKSQEAYDAIFAWVEAKKVKPSDLVFLNPLKTDLHWSLLIKGLKLIIELRLSYADSLKYLELFSELILMGFDETLFEMSHDQKSWLTHLKKLRYPATTARDENLKTKLEKLPWPYGAKTKFERRGDRAGIELKVFVTSEADLIKIISSLERVKEQLRDC